MIELSLGPLDPENPSEDYWLERLRSFRDAILTRSDWTQLPDAPVDADAWAAYRQALRDFPATWTPGPTADFPDTP